MALGIAQGLMYLHAHVPPIIHRDLSANNVLLSEHGIKITDFGLSRYKTQSQLQTERGCKAGTVEYWYGQLLSF